jgi:hypothetical protein
LSNQNQPQNPLKSVELVETYVWAFVVIAITLILAGIVFSLLYSVTFVTQPIKSMAPIDQAYTKMLNDIVLLIVGGIGGVVGKKGVGMAVNAVSGNTPPKPEAPTVSGPTPSPASPIPDWNWMGFQNAALDESWVPPPPPSTPPNHIDPAVEEIANERAAARSEA